MKIVVGFLGRRYRGFIMLEMIDKESKRAELVCSLVKDGMNVKEATDFVNGAGGGRL